MASERLWLVDGYNVLHAVLLGQEREVPWWRREYQQLVLDWVVERFPAPLTDHNVVLAFDASRPLCDAERVAHAWVNVVYVPDVDEWMVQRCAQSECGSGNTTCVVTADRSLGDRARARGARVAKPWQCSRLRDP